MKRLVVTTLFQCTLAFALWMPSVNRASVAAGAPVTLEESNRSFFLDNGILRVSIQKRTGEIVSIKYQGLELLAQNSAGGALGGYWSSVGRIQTGSQQSTTVRINPNGNDVSVVETGPLPSTSAMQRDGIRAFWVERPITFDASLMKGGVNVFRLKSHANSWSQGVMYDVVRLELDEPSPVASK